MSTAASNGRAWIRFKGDVACPICGGCDDDARGQGVRCHGGMSGDAVHCSREEHAGNARFNIEADAYLHFLKGKCPCGKEHGPADPKPTKTLEKTYPYYDKAGVVVHKTLRYRLSNGDKKFSQQGVVDGKTVPSLKGVRTVLYRLPELLKADPSETVFVVEGEKDADRLAGLGAVATTNPMGAGKWKPHYSEWLKARHVVVLPDNDDAGRQHGPQVARSLQGVAASVKIVELPGLPEKGDVSDFLAAGGTLDQIHELAAKTPAAAASIASAAEPEWIVTDKGAWSPCVSNIVRWLEWKGRDKDYLRDKFLDTLTAQGREIEDVDPIRLAIAVEEDRRVPSSTGKVKEAIDVVAGRNAVDSLKDYFDSLRWDGTPRVDGFFDRVYDAIRMSFEAPAASVDPSEIDKAVQYCRFVSRSFLIGLAARALDPGCQVDTMPVLIGDQGLNKSASFRELCPRPEWFTDDIGDICTKDACANLKGILIVEFAEFNRLMRASAAAAKSFLTKRDDRYREAYGRYTVKHDRRCVFVGTTNEEMPLTDTENRRFYPIRVGMADLDYIRKNRDQVLAEAAHRFRAGEEWWTHDKKILDVVRGRQDMAQKPDQWAEVLAEKLLSLESTFTQAEAFDALAIPVERRTGKAVSDMGNALKKAGCKSLPRERVPGVGRVTRYKNPQKPPGVAY